MNAITTHVLDTVLGKPAAGILVTLERRINEQWTPVVQSVTDPDGRCRDLTDNSERGTYRLTFKTGDYLSQKGRSTLYPEISIVFECSGDAHYHLPLLLSDNCFTTYRGS
jgi:5-hydroxyisourate hydrolase